MSTANKRGFIQQSIKRRLWDMPCRICGRADDTEIDHIVAVADGGDSQEPNLQPLCRVCNVAKRHLKTNEAVAKWIAENPDAFAKRQQWRTVRWVRILSGNHW